MTTPATSKPPTLNERTQAILEQRDRLKRDGWRFRDYADGRVMATHKARGLKTAKHDSMVETIYEAARLAEQHADELEGTGEVASSPVAATAESDEASSSGEWHEFFEQTLGDGCILGCGKGQLDPIHRNPNQAPPDGKCPENCGHTVEEHKAFDDGVLDGETGSDLDACPHDVGPLREAWLAGHSVGVGNRSADPATNGDVVEDTPAIETTPVDESSTPVESRNGNGSDPRRFVQELPVAVTPERRTELLEELRQLAKERGREAAKLESAKSAFKSADKRIELRQQVIDDALDRGTEIKPVECREVFDFGLRLALTYRTDTYDEVSRRPMTKSELQPPLLSV